MSTENREPTAAVEETNTLREVTVNLTVMDYPHKVKITTTVDPSLEEYLETVPEEKREQESVRVILNIAGFGITEALENNMSVKKVSEAEAE